MTIVKTVFHGPHTRFCPPEHAPSDSRTLHGAEVGDLFMTLIHTCQLCGANSFDYLTELQRHAQELAAEPAEWMPWNYRETLQPAGVG
jgi:transposase